MRHLYLQDPVGAMVLGMAQGGRHLRVGRPGKCLATWREQQMLWPDGRSAALRHQGLRAGTGQRDGLGPGQLAHAVLRA